PLGFGNQIAEFVVGQAKNELVLALQVRAQCGFKSGVGEVRSRIAGDAAIGQLRINLSGDGSNFRHHAAAAAKLDIAGFRLQVPSVAISPVWGSCRATSLPSEETLPIEPLTKTAVPPS